MRTNNQARQKNLLAAVAHFWHVCLYCRLPFSPRKNNHSGCYFLLRLIVSHDLAHHVWVSCPHGTVMFLHICQHLLHGLIQELGGHFGASTQNTSFLRDFFPARRSPPIPAAVQVMADEECVIVVYRDRDVIQHRQQIFLDIADIGGVLPHPVKYILDM